ncbi:MAG TPA: hypothetical protein VNB24_00125 [Acidimicrobiales bacterium]|nr:hypothetical protein [Acidimicrobiales bacterium]
MIELQRKTARKLIGRTVCVACLDGSVVAGRVAWCSDDEVAVDGEGSHSVINLDRVIGMVKRSN